MKAILEYAGWLCKLEQGELERLNDSELEAKLVVVKNNPITDRKIILAQSDACHELITCECAGGRCPGNPYFFDAEFVRYILSKGAYHELVSSTSNRVSWILDPEEVLLIEKPDGIDTAVRLAEDLVRLSAGEGRG